MTFEEAEELLNHAEVEKVAGADAPVASGDSGTDAGGRRVREAPAIPEQSPELDRGCEVSGGGLWMGVMVEMLVALELSLKALEGP